MLRQRCEDEKTTPDRKKKNIEKRPGGGGGGGALDLETTVRAAQNLAFKIGPLQCSEKMVNFIPLQCISTTKNNPYSAPINFFCLVSCIEMSKILAHL